MPFQTEFNFTLPRGYIDRASGQVHQVGQMRLATALDEVEAVQDPRVQANAAYLSILLLSKVIVQLGTLRPVTPHIVANLYVIDLAYLEDLYERINSPTPISVNAVCPYCSHQFGLQVAPIAMNATA